jgi:hypothetical protein
LVFDHEGDDTDENQGTEQEAVGVATGEVMAEKAIDRIRLPTFKASFVDRSRAP